MRQPPCLAPASCPASTARRSRPRCHRPASLVLGMMLAGATGVAVGGATARAQQVAASRSFDGDLFQPAIGPRNFLTLSSPDVPNHLQFVLGLHFDLQRFPYKIATGRPNETTETKYPISTQLKSELHLAIGLIDRLQIGVAVPVTLAMRGDGIDGASGVTTGSDLSTAGLGDLRIEVKGQILTVGEDDQFVLGAVIGGTVPTGKKDAYIGEKSATGRAEVLAALTVGRV